MTTVHASRRQLLPGVELIGRQAERRELRRLAEAVQAGQSRALVLHGEPGVGKTALLDCLAAHAAGLRVERAAGVQSEMELAFAGLHQLCAPMLDRLEALPAPQRDALRTAFGLSAGPAPDRFLVGLAVLGLLSDVAAQQPLLCLVDDEQWLDRASAQVLAFAARRLGAESVGLVFAAREPGGDLAGLPELAVAGLGEGDARALLDTVLAGPLDTRVRDQIVAETGGNPLALVELPWGLMPPGLAGEFGLPGPGRPGVVAGSIEDSFGRRVAVLPPETRQLLLLAAADPTGDQALVWRAATRLGLGADAATPAAEAGLAEFGTRVRFRHPLVRSAVYRAAPAGQRQAAHRALAEVTDPQLDPDRRAWHRAQAAAGPDEYVAAELEHSAGRARARGGLAAAAAFLERAATLTLDPGQRASRALAAAQAKLQAGAFDTARDLLAMAETGPLSEFQRARVDQARARLELLASRGSDTPSLLLRAARRLEPIDTALSRATYLDALTAGIFAGRLAGPGADVLEVARAAAAAPAPADPRAPDLLLEGLARHYNDGFAAGLPILRRALAAFGGGLPAEEELRWLWMACIAANHAWEDDAWEALSARYVELARGEGALSVLPLALSMRAQRLLLAGELGAAASAIAEEQAAAAATGASPTSYGALALAALRGDQDGLAALTEATARDVTERGEGTGVTIASLANALLSNGLGRYDEAMAHARKAVAHQGDVGSPNWAIAELVESAMRSGHPEIAARAYARLSAMASASGTDWALGMQARSHALISEGEQAERSYREAIDRLGRTHLRICLARAHLLYGEWLRRERRRADAREQLHLALAKLEAMGIGAFAERARRELAATGETARRRGVPGPDAELTAQETQIARLARDGLSNPEIGARLFISAHTVQYHLRKVFAKLGIASRSQLGQALPEGPSAV